MKNIIKFYTILILVFCCLCTLVSCSDENSNKEETKSLTKISNTDIEDSDFAVIQAIEYTNQSELNNSYDVKTIKSYCYIKYSKESVSVFEYENAENKINWLSDELEIERDGKANNGLSIRELEDLTNKSFYYKDVSGDLFSSSNTYYKVTFSDVIISYVNVKFFDDGSFLVKQLDRSGDTVTTRIKPLYYSASYFTE